MDDDDLCPVCDNPLPDWPVRCVEQVANLGPHAAQADRFCSDRCLDEYADPAFERRMN